MLPLETRGISRTSPTSKIELSVSLMSFSRYLRTSFLCGKGPRYPSVDTVKLEDSQKYEQCPHKNCEKVYFY